MELATTLLLAVLCHLSEGKFPEKISLNSDGEFVNKNGESVLFHGFNSVYKSQPYFNANDSSDTRIRYYKNWGFNVVRLGILWHPSMPTRGKLNHTYLDAIETQVDKFSQYGIYVILDMHQDSLSSLYGSYDAIPKWLLNDFPQANKYVRYPWPYSRNASGDWEGYTTFACQKAFQCIYDNVSNSWGYWGDFWEEVSLRFRDKNNVLGYELINEPFAGNMYTNVLRALPGYAGRRNLLPVYDYLVDRIRAMDLQTLIFFEGVTWSVFASGKLNRYFGPGFDRVPGSLQSHLEGKRSVFSYHYYCPLIELANSSHKFSDKTRHLCDEIIMPRMFSSVNNVARELGCGLFLTEFGSCVPDGNPSSINTIECNAVLNGADANLQSWTYWNSQFFDEREVPIIKQVKSFSRVYPHRTAGKLETIAFSVDDGSAFYAFRSTELTNKTAIKGESIASIFLPLELYYKFGFNIVITPTYLSFRQRDDEKHMLEILAPKAGLGNGILVEVSINAKVN